MTVSCGHMPFERPVPTPTSPDTLNEQQRQNIGKIAKLKCGASPLAETVLVLLGEKPATTIGLSPWNDPPERVEQALREAGLCTSRKTDEPREDGGRYVKLAVARDQATLDRLSKAQADQDHQEYGELMGFPKTAIEAFQNQELRFKNASDADRDVIFGMMLSRDHWQEELALLRRWSQLIKHYAPNLYEGIRGAPDEHRAEKKP